MSFSDRRVSNEPNIKAYMSTNRIADSFSTAVLLQPTAEAAQYTESFALHAYVCALCLWVCLSYLPCLSLPFSWYHSRVKLTQQHVLLIV